MNENSVGAVLCKWEIYRQDPSTGALTEWGEGSDVFTMPESATPVKTITSVYVTAVDTNAFSIRARLKRVGGTSNNQNFFCGVGTGYNTHMEFGIASSLLLTPYTLKTQIANITLSLGATNDLYFVGSGANTNRYLITTTLANP